MKSLVYTIAFDDGPIPYHRWMAMMLISSLQRSGYTGKVLLFTNSEAQPFRHGRCEVEQVRLELSDSSPANAAYRMKYLVARELPAGYDRYLFADCDCLFLRNPEEILRSSAELLYAEEPWSEITGSQNNAYLTDYEMRKLDRRGINSGTFALDAVSLPNFMEAWKLTDERPPLRQKRYHDQPAFIRTVLDWPGEAQRFCEPFAVRYPDCETMRTQDLLQAGLLHFCGIGTAKKLQRMLGYYVMLYGESLAPFLFEMMQG